MSGSKGFVWAALMVPLMVATVFAGELDVLPPTIDGFNKIEMMNHYLRSQAAEEFEKWKQRYETIKTPEQVADYQQRLRTHFLGALGEFPRRTPLNARITGVIKRKGYRVEKVIFESQPRHFVTALLFVPESSRHKQPYPGVLVPCGHSRDGKGYETYQSMGALLALNGMAALVFDPIDQGERGQCMEQWPDLWGTRGHTMTGVGSILLGRNTAWFEVWDGMRGIDYLQSRPEVDSERIGCTGNSGGGTQTSYLMALDNRIDAAAPSCYITNLYERILELGAQDAEQNIYGQLSFGMDHADYLMMRAPTPIIICAATHDFFDIRGTWQSFRYAKRLYSRLGFAERIDILENDAKHNYNQLQRQSVVRWMARWLLGNDSPITEPEIELLTRPEFTCSPEGQVMLMRGARSTYDINRSYENTLNRRRQKLWEDGDRGELLDRVRELTGIRALQAIPDMEVEQAGVLKRNGYEIRKLILKPEEGVYLPALQFVPAQINGQPVLYVNEAGKAADLEGIEAMVKSGRAVLAVDLRGTGETQQDKQGYFRPHFGTDGQDVYTAYLLGRSYVGMRAEDVMACARMLGDRSEGAVDLVAVGNVAVPALHAAALEGQLFESVRLARPLVSWSNVIEKGLSFNQLVNTVHGALRVYDLPDLAKACEKDLTIEQPLNALGKPLENN